MPALLIWKKFSGFQFPQNCSLSSEWISKTYRHYHFLVILALFWIDLSLQGRCKKNFFLLFFGLHQKSEPPRLKRVVVNNVQFCLNIFVSVLFIFIYMNKSGGKSIAYILSYIDNILYFYPRIHTIELRKGLTINTQNNRAVCSRINIVTFSLLLEVEENFKWTFLKGGTCRIANVGTL